MPRRALTLTPLQTASHQTTHGLDRGFETIERIGRGGGIRTRDPLRPRQVRYQAALRPDILPLL